MTASQIIDQLCEVFTFSRKKTSQVTLYPFNINLELILLDNSFKPIKSIHGSDIIKETYQSFPYIEAAEPSKRIFIELKNPKNDLSFALDFYQVGKSPGFSSKGLESQKDQTSNTIVLYKTEQNFIRKIWILPDENNFTVLTEATWDDFYKTLLFTEIQKLLKSEFLLSKITTGEKVTFHYNNYGCGIDKGLGVVANETTTWSEKI